MAGSPVVSRISTGPAPFGSTGPGSRTGGTGQVSHGSSDQARFAPLSGLSIAHTGARRLGFSGSRAVAKSVHTTDRYSESAGLTISFGE